MMPICCSTCRRPPFDSREPGPAAAPSPAVGLIAAAAPNSAAGMSGGAATGSRRAGPRLGMDAASGTRRLAARVLVNLVGSGAWTSP